MAPPEPRQKRVRDRADVTGPQSDQHVARPKLRFQRRAELHETLDPADAVRPECGPGGLDHQPGADARYRLLARRVDPRHEHHVGGRQGSCELVGKGTRATVQVRLERDDLAPLAEHLAGGLERRPHLGGMVRVVVDHRDACGVPQHLEPAIHALEFGERWRCRSRLEIEGQHHPEGGEGVPQVVRSTQRQLVIAQRAPAPARRKAGAIGFVLHRVRPQCRPRIETVAQPARPGPLQAAPRAGLVPAGDHAAPDRDAVDELGESGLQSGRAAVGVEMLGLHRRDDRLLRPQRQERAVVLVRLHHVGCSAPDARVAAPGRDTPPDQRGRFQARRLQGQGGERGRRGLAVGAGDGDQRAGAHQLGQRLASLEDR